MKSKQTILLSTLLILTLLSCNKRPLADFTIDNESPEPLQVIHFTNTSIDGYTYDWNFGDGTTSTAENPAHIFTESGSYFVELAVHNKKNKQTDTHAKYIEVQSNRIEEITHIWNYEKVKSETIYDGVSSGESTFYLADFFTVHSIEFKSNFTYETILGTDMNTGVWELLSDENFIRLDLDTFNISTITDNSFVLNSSQITTNGISTTIDNNEMTLTR